MKEYRETIMQYTQKDICRLLNIKRETLRHYEKEGIIRPEVNADNQYRFYDDYQFYLISECKRYQINGFSIGEIRQMLQQERGGAIVNTTSSGALAMKLGFGAYGPSKAGVIALTKLAAIEYGRQKIRVNAVCPGPTKGTQLMDNLLSSKPDEEEILTSRVIPTGRVGTTEDIAKAVLWLCSDDAKHITGVNLSVDGGVHLN